MSDITQSTPISEGTLRGARIAVASSEDLQGRLRRATEEKWDVETLHTSLIEGLSEYLLDSDKEISEVAYLLAVEHVKRDPNKTLLVSLETGKALAQLPQEAFYVPPPAEREGSDVLVPQAPRLRPEIEAA